MGLGTRSSPKGLSGLGLPVYFSVTPVSGPRLCLLCWAGGQMSMRLALATPSSLLQDFWSYPIYARTRHQQFSPPHVSSLPLDPAGHDTHLLLLLPFSETLSQLTSSSSCHSVPLLLFPAEIPQNTCLFLGVQFHDSWSLLNLPQSLWLLPMPFPWNCSVRVTVTSASLNPVVISQPPVHLVLRTPLSRASLASSFQAPFLDSLFFRISK